jgi:hypothetical protein
MAVDHDDLLHQIKPWQQALDVPLKVAPRVAGGNDETESWHTEQEHSTYHSPPEKSEDTLLRPFRIGHGQKTEIAENSN